jgi:hypothetical protein
MLSNEIEIYLELRPAITWVVLQNRAQNIVSTKNWIVGRRQSEGCIAICKQIIDVVLLCRNIFPGSDSIQMPPGGEK